MRHQSQHALNIRKVRRLLAITIFTWHQNVRIMLQYATHLLILDVKASEENGSRENRKCECPDSGKCEG